MPSMNFVFLCLCLSVNILHINRTFFSFGTNFVLMHKILVFAVTSSDYYLKM